jgi:hypothetical protein
MALPRQELATGATMESAVYHQLIRKGKCIAILTVGIDLAKKLFAVDGVNEAGKPEPAKPATVRWMEGLALAAL